MSDSLIDNFQRKQRFRKAFQDYWAVCAILHRRNDLAQLIAWAKTKRLEKPEAYYWFLLSEEEQRLWRCERRNPRVTQVAKFLVTLSGLLNRPIQNRYRKGYAAATGIAALSISRLSHE